MYRIEISVDWHTPILPSKKDHGDYRGFVRTNFRRWLIGAGIDASGNDGALYSIGFPGFYLTAYLSHFWRSEKVYR